MSPRAAWSCCASGHLLRVQKRLLQAREGSLHRYYHVVVALSGGVDSSVSAALLHHQLQQSPMAAGSDDATTGMTSLSAVYMSNWNAHDDDSLNCTLERDWEDAQKVAHHLNHLSIRRQPFEADYWTTVFEPYLADIIEKGRMGNPDIGCNSHIKFGSLLKFCWREFGPDTHLATGHYARLWHRGGTQNNQIPECVARALEEDRTGVADWIESWGACQKSEDSSSPSILLAAADRTKDQSYFLSACSGVALQHVIFPLGDLYKTTAPDRQTTTARTVRQLAETWQLPTAQKPDSMGICFVGNRRQGFHSFLQNNYLPDAVSPVDFVDIDTGQVVGMTAPHHAHPTLYVPGQGAKIGGTKQKFFIVGHHDIKVNQYSCNKNSKSDHPAHSIVWVCAGTHHPALYSKSLTTSNVNWITGACPQPLLTDGAWRMQCRIRHLQPLVDCTVRLMDNDDKEQGEQQVLEVTFDKPVRGISAGQQAVFYGLNGLICFGGGPISKRGPSYWEQGLALPNDLAPSGHNDRSLDSKTRLAL